MMRTTRRATSRPSLLVCALRLADHAARQRVGGMGQFGLQSFAGECVLRPQLAGVGEAVTGLGVGDPEPLGEQLLDRRGAQLMGIGLVDEAGGHAG